MVSGPQNQLLLFSEHTQVIPGLPMDAWGKKDDKGEEEGGG